VPADLIVALNGLVVVFVVSLEYVRRQARTIDAAERRRPPRPGGALPAGADTGEGPP
jgi:hypothetical protein